VSGDLHRAAAEIYSRLEGFKDADRPKLEEVLRSLESEALRAPR
jgi:hypothetical protein